MSKRITFILALGFGLMAFAGQASADTYTIFINDSDQPLHWANDKYNGDVAPGQQIWSWLPLEVQGPTGPIKVVDPGVRCGPITKWEVSASTPAGNQSTCLDIPIATVGCVTVVVDNSNARFGQVPWQACADLWNNQAGFNSPQAQEAYKIIMQILQTLLELA